MDLRKLLVGLILVATAAFAVAVVWERPETDVHSESVTTGNNEQGEAEPHSEAGEGSESSSEAEAADEATILGVDPESVPLAVAAVAGSLLLAVLLWFRPSWRWLLIVTVIGMALFAVLDVREVAHQLDESRNGLAALAILVALAHTMAAVVAATLLVRGDGLETNRSLPSHEPSA